MSLPYMVKAPPRSDRVADRPGRRSLAVRGKRLSETRESPGSRLAQLAESELDELQRQLALARGGRDRALHKARKTIQRLRAIVRLLAPIDPAQAQRENLFLRRLRRRLAPLRDAAARRQTFLLLASRPRWHEHRASLRTLATLEADHHAQAWAAHPDGSRLWVGVDRDCTALRERLPQWPFAHLDEAVLVQALKGAEKRARRRIDDAQGAHGRELRHELRRKLRRYANLRRAAAVARGEEVADAETLLNLAKRCGHEGDLWMAVASARRVARQRPAFRPLVRALEEERRRMCRHHDRLLHRAGLD